MPLLGLSQQPSPASSCSLQFGWKTSTLTYWVTLNPGLGPRELPMGAHSPLQTASVSIRDVCRWELRADLRPWSAPLLFDFVPQAALKPLWRVRVLGSFMTKVSSDLGMTPAPDQKRKPVPFIFQPSAARELGRFEVFEDCHHPSLPRPLEIPAKAESPALGSQLPLHPLSSGQGERQSHFLVTQRETEVH